ncbi:MAG TPA: hypothetical protein VHM93_02650 [Candidatus Acidoferrum sp.]|jgi:hypothetical protein|nr:hypothetical protein [Candidatus Acidoferrum sp.]
MGLAGVHVALGDNDQASFFLDRTYQLNPKALLDMKCAPELENLRSDPRIPLESW